MTWRELSAERFNTIKSKVVVDVRSPFEHLKEYIPDSVNIPILSDPERVEVGTVYKKEGEFKARKLALSLVAPKIPQIVGDIIAAKRENHTLVVHCWRGGMRSEAVCSFLSLMGVDCWRLAGGYKAWRKCVLDDFGRDHYPFSVIVLDGLTGVGKTDVLLELEAQGGDILDLEGLAVHRGSTFGGLGLGEQPTQKNFDSLLWDKLKDKTGGFLFVEAESRKIGNVTVPEFLINRIKSGPRVLLTSEKQERVKRINRDYEIALYKDRFQSLLKAVGTFKERLGGKRLIELSDMLDHGDTSKFIEILLSEYYDPLYRRHLARPEDYVLTIDSTDSSFAARQILEWCRSSSRTLDSAIQ